MYLSWKHPSIQIVNTYSPKEIFTHILCRSIDDIPKSFVNRIFYCTQYIFQVVIMYVLYEFYLQNTVAKDQQIFDDIWHIHASLTINQFSQLMTVASERYRNNAKRGWGFVIIAQLCRCYGNHNHQNLRNWRGVTNWPELI